jgi:hypothetical protein
MKPNPLGAFEAYVSWMKVSWGASACDISTDDGVEFLLLLRDGFKHDLVGFLFLYDCPWLVK